MESQEAFFEAIIDGDVLAVEEMLAREQSWLMPITRQDSRRY
jgi:hypothetical protein